MKPKPWHWLVLIAVALAVFVAPYACPWPDGLEHVVERLGFADRGEGPPVVRSPLPDYCVPFLRNSRLGTAVSGLLGAAVMFGLVYGLGRLLARRGATDDR